MNHPIDYALISHAIRHYEQLGFKYIEAPWIADGEATRSTLPEGKTPFYLDGGSYDMDDVALVGSAEQGFVQLMLDGKLPLGQYVAAGPCFRDDEVDELHQKTFFKVELIRMFESPPVHASGYRLAYEAMGFFQRLIQGKGKLEMVRTDDGYDINLNGIEIGSYGVRSFEGHHWVYGTGLAEPRFSMAKAKR